MSDQARLGADTDDQASGLLTRLVRARTLGPEALESLRHDMATDSRIGIGYLGIGAVVAGILLSIRGLAIFLLNWSVYDNPWLTVGAWALIALAMGGGCIVANSQGGRLPTPAYIGVLLLLGAAVVLDLVSAGGFTADTPEVTVI
ncbi:MAG: hypothetical protein JWR01_247, partial [Subtercola sp.]|nr:hypothetical protein [Subtercola sp.]